MRGNRRTVLLLTVFIFMFNLISIFSFQAVAQDITKKIKIGYFNDGDYMGKNDAGEYTGFDFEYIQNISKYTGWEYEVVECGTWENAYSMLRDGKIDMIPAVYRTQEREKEILYSDIPVCNVYTTLNVLKDDKRYHYDDFASFTDMKVGVIKDSMDVENFQKFCEEKQISPQVVYYPEVNKMLRALSDGRLDAIAVTHLGKNSTFRSVARFSPDSLYVGVSKARQDLLTELKKAQNELELRDPFFESKLYDKYFSVSIAQKPAFTKQEAEYIKNAGKITAGYDPAWQPLSYTNSKTGEFSGICADLFSNISEVSGLQFEFVPVQKHSEIDPQIDVICAMENDYLWASKNNMITTSFYLRAPIVMISKRKSNNNNHFAMVEGYQMAEKIAKDFPGRKIKGYASSRKCVEAVLSGEVSSAFLNTYVSDYLLAELGSDQLSVATLTNYVDELSIGISKSTDPLLFSILDKCVQFTASEQIDEMILNNSQTSHNTSWSNIIKQNPVGVAVGVFVILVFLFLVFVYIFLIKVKSNKRIQSLLYNDRLTGIWNLNKFNIEAEKILGNSKKGNYALVYADINQFKTINDTFGFTQGDRLLCVLAKVFSKALDTDEICARVSADQFVLLLKYEDWAILNQRMEQIDTQLSQMIELAGAESRVILVFGAYVIEDDRKQPVSLMMDFANYARRSAKNTHKSVVIRYDEKMRSQELYEHELMAAMGQALKNGEFIPYLQPKVNMDTLEIVGSEALVRWDHPQRGLMLPGQFLPLFERNGFIMELDLYMFERVCVMIQKWMEEGHKILPVSCNFSRLHTRDSNFPEKLKKIADHYKVPYQYLELEITESVVMEDLEQIVGQIRTLREAGFRVSIDDFGAGYSSLGLLQQLTVDFLKMDRSFFNKESLNRRDRVIIQSIIHVAHELGMMIICEGVENRQQSDMLVGMECYIAQSFYFGMPMPVSEFEKLD